jgi:tRNA modification GTPase
VLSDPIAALATPPGRSALALIRVSGRGALAVAERVIARTGETGLAELPERTAVLRRFLDADGQPLDEGLVTVFRGPRSYTGEDLVEFSCHGGLLVSARLLAALQAAGARQAAPGEFTRRALLNGKLDLLQAEAVGDLIDATATAQGRAALRQLEGGLSRRLLALREGLVEAQALLAYDVDFPEEDDGPIPRERIRERLDAVAGDLRRLLATAAAGERVRSGALVVLAGRPNAGKSSLFNALLGVERALVTEIPGTTRDTIEADSEVAGWPVRLADTAGLRDTGERIEQLGIEVSRRYLGAADLVLLCVELGRPLGPDELAVTADFPTLVVRTKADLTHGQAGRQAEGQGGASGEVAVSALSGTGLDVLREGLAARLFDDAARLADLEPLLTRERHRVALTRAAAALAEATAELEREPVLSAHQVLQAIAALEELIGLVHPDEVLGRVFERFCVGK